MPFNINQRTAEKLMPVQPHGELPINFYQVEAPRVNDAKNGFDVLEEVITSETLVKLTKILNDYKTGKTNLEKRIVDNEEWWKLRHWNQMRRQNEKKSEVEPTSAWLFNCLANKHADAMDNFPAPNILPREESDVEEAKMLSNIIPVVLEHDNFEQTYSDTWDYKLKSGTGVYGVFWDKAKCNGLGDISIKKIDLLNLFWEPGITNIQDSKYVFLTTLKDNEELEETYPELVGKLGGKSVNVAEYEYDDTVNTDDKSVVVDCYYKVQTAQKTILHYIKYVGDTVLYATENEEEYRHRGLYDHGRYPFEFDVLFKQEGTPTGFGYLDVGKSCQEYIDRMDQNIIKNMTANAKPRAAISDSAGISEDEFSDLSKDIVHVAGRLSDDQFMFIKGPSLDGNYITVKNNKIEELKEVTGNRDVSTGGTASGVTAASAIAAMQEAGSKLSRDSIKSSYRTYRQIILLVIELIRQFYDVQRCFRIVGQSGASGQYEFVPYSNKNIVPQSQGGIEYGVDTGYRIPIFDVEVTAEKQSPYSKMSQNELALQLYNNGFFNPQMTDQAKACLEMMDFDSKDAVLKQVSENGTMYEQLIARTQQVLFLAQRVDMHEGTNLAEQVAAEVNGTPAPPFIQGNMAGAVQDNPQLGGDIGTEPTTTKKARERVAQSTTPN
jgi:hypothetical protein